MKYHMVIQGYLGLSDRLLGEDRLRNMANGISNNDLPHVRLGKRVTGNKNESVKLSGRP